MEKDKPENIPAQQQERQPGFETEMEPQPDFTKNLAGQAQRLPGKTALITGGQWNWTCSCDRIRKGRRGCRHFLS